MTQSGKIQTSFERRWASAVYVGFSIIVAFDYDQKQVLFQDQVLEKVLAIYMTTWRPHGFKPGHCSFNQTIILFQVINVTTFVHYLLLE